MLFKCYSLSSIRRLSSLESISLRSDINRSTSLASEAPSALIERCLAGEALWGDALNAEQIRRWYESEEQGYRKIKESRMAADKSPEGDHYRVVNQRYGFKHLPPGPLGNALSLGGFDGDEISPILARLESATILDPAFEEGTRIIDGTSIKTCIPNPSGDIAFSDQSFDLSIALSVLHHIPNVSHVLDELVRVTKKGGFLLIREPMVSMGDWRSRNALGLTDNERGLPLPWMQEKIRELPVETVSLQLWNFPVVPRLCHRWGLGQAYNKSVLTLLDQCLCQLTRWNSRYHRTRILQKLAPVAFFAVLRLDD